MCPAYPVQIRTICPTFSRLKNKIKNRKVFNSFQEEAILEHAQIAKSHVCRKIGSQKHNWSNNVVVSLVWARKFQECLFINVCIFER
jgi:hypothetical protein